MTGELFIEVTERIASQRAKVSAKENHNNLLISQDKINNNENHECEYPKFSEHRTS